MTPTTQQAETIAVTGGAGYIGSHAAKLLLEAGSRVLIIDNLSRGTHKAVDALDSIANGHLAFLKANIDDPAITTALRDHNVTSVMHFAALAYVRESVERPLDYHINNTAAATRFLQFCAETNVTRFVFSSTCATYGTVPQDQIPITESTPTKPINPYGWSKLHFEQVLRDYATACKATSTPFAFAILRYFNVAGADPTGLIGENHNPETHLIPNAILAALGKKPALTIYGNDHPTPDGTTIRDYIHVTDLARAHLLALDALNPTSKNRELLYNLGLGTGTSIKQILESVERVTGNKVPVKWESPHPADPPVLQADATKITNELGWKPTHTKLDEIVKTANDWLASQS